MLRAAVCADGVEQMTADATLAVDQEPRWSPWRDTALLVLGEAMLLTGDVDGATKLFAETTTVGAGAGNADNTVVSEAELARCWRWTTANGTTRRLTSATALTVVDDARMRDYPISILAFAAAARLAWRNGDQERTTRQLTHAMRIRSSCTITLPWLAVRSRLQTGEGAMGHGRDEDGPPAPGRDRRDHGGTSRPGPPRRGGLGLRRHLRRERGRHRRDAAQPGGAPRAPVPPDPPHVPRDRRASVPSRATPSRPKSRPSTASSVSPLAATRSNRRRRSASWAAERTHRLGFRPGRRPSSGLGPCRP